MIKLPTYCYKFTSKFEPASLSFSGAYYDDSLIGSSSGSLLFGNYSASRAGSGIVISSRSWSLSIFNRSISGIGSWYGEGLGETK